MVTLAPYDAWLSGNWQHGRCVCPPGCGAQKTTGYGVAMLAIAALVTFVLTTVFSMAGLGAALILIPVFMAFGVEVHTAMATALLLNALGMSIASATFIRKGLVDWRLVVPMLLVAVALSPVGVWAAHGLDRGLLLWLFLAFLVFAAAMMLFYSPKPRAARASLAETLALGLPVGGAAGFIGGLLGVGGGNIIIPALVTAGLEPKRASASGLLRGDLRLLKRIPGPCPGRPNRHRAAGRHGARDRRRGRPGGLVGDRAPSGRSVEKGHRPGLDGRRRQNGVGLAVIGTGAPSPYQLA